MKNQKRKLFAALDVVIIAMVIVAAAFAFLSQFNTSDSDLTCVIRANGEVVHKVSLDNVSESKVYTVHNVNVKISHECVSVSSSDCPDKLCENTGEISRGGQSIVCLPNKVSVTLVCEENAVDAVVG